MYPHRLEMALRFSCNSLPELIELTMAAWRRAELPSPVSWTAPTEGTSQPGETPPPAIFAQAPDAPDSALFRFGVEVSCAFFVRSGDEHWTVSLNHWSEALKPPGLVKHVGIIDPQAYWDSWSVERTGGRGLCTRALDVNSGVELYEAIAERQWAMARAVKPGGCTLYQPLPEEHEEALFTRGERTLHMVGYLEDTKTVELSCAILDDQHIHGWEILGLHDMREEGTTTEGYEVEAIRVVFLDEAVARREKRPLLDARIQVFAYDQEGELLQLTE